MRIDQIGIQRGEAVQTQSVQPSAPLETGDVLTATVQKSNGDSVVLKTADGKLLNARLAENAALFKNDRVEFIVAQSGKDGLVLRIAYVEPQSPEAVSQVFLSAEENALLQAFEQAGVQADARTLSAALLLMRQNGLSPKSALFFALNRMEPTPERMAAYQALTSGQGPGETLYEIAQALSEALGQALPEAAQPQTDAAQTVQGQRAQQPAQGPLLAAQDGASAAQGTETTSASAQAQSLQTNPNASSARPVTDNAVLQAAATGETLNAQTALAENVLRGGAQADVAQGTQTPQAGEGASIAAGGTVGAESVVLHPDGVIQLPVSDAAPNGAAQTGAAVERAAGEGGKASAPDALRGEALEKSATATPGETVQASARGVMQGETAAILQGASAPQEPAQEPVQTPMGAPQSAPEELKELPKRILNLFLELTGSEGGEDVKKFVSESHAKLEALKFMAGKYDDESMRTVQPQLERASEQTKLAQDVTRFVCYQLPVHSGEYGTAELYVYRRAKGKSKIDADNASVLLSIPTESFGRVETLLRTENKTLTLSFSVERESGVGALKEGVRELRKTLSVKTPYRLGEMRVSQLRERTTVENAEAVLSGSIGKSGAALDVKI